MGESDDLGTAITTLFDAIQHQSRMTHSGVAIATTAILDSGLELALKRAMRPLSAKLYKCLFEPFRPLSTFSSKIVMAYALGIISKDTFEELEKIRQIRNAFAHSSVVLHFGSDPIAPIFASLKRPQVASNKPAAVFVACAQVVATSLEKYMNSMGEPHARGAVLDAS
jgi:DNA-binding MltR family transcriptional regulator